MVPGCFACLCFFLCPFDFCLGCLFVLLRLGFFGVCYLCCVVFVVCLLILVVFLCFGLRLDVCFFLFV